MIELHASGSLGRFDSWHRMVAGLFRPCFSELASNYLAAAIVITPPPLMAWYWLFRIVLPARNMRRVEQEKFLEKIEYEIEPLGRR